MNVEVYTAPVLMPVTVDEAATFCRVTSAEENAVLEMAIHAAWERAELLTGRRLLTTVLDLYLPEFPDDESDIELPETPVQSVTSVTYYDTNNDSQTLTVTTDYAAHARTREGRVYLPEGCTWPDTYERPDAVVVRYTAGWTAAASIPYGIRAWILQAVATIYEHREHTVTGTIVGSLPRDFAAGLLDRETILHVG